VIKKKKEGNAVFRGLKKKKKKRGGTKKKKRKD